MKTLLRRDEVADTLEDAMQLVVTLKWVVEMNGGMSPKLESEVRAAIEKLREAKDKVVLTYLTQTSRVLQ